MTCEPDKPEGLLAEWRQRPLGEIVRSWFVLPPDSPAAKPAAPVEASATPVCHRCSAPQHPGAFFCHDCGAAVGPHNNVLPYVRVFSLGEVLRSGVYGDRVLPGWQRTGYVLLSLVLPFPFAPFYWTRLAMAQMRAARDMPRPDAPDRYTRIAEILWTILLTDVLVLGGIGVCFSDNWYHLLDAVCWLGGIVRCPDPVKDLVHCATWQIPALVLVAGAVGTGTTIYLLRRSGAGGLPLPVGLFLAVSLLLVSPALLAAFVTFLLELTGF